MHIQLFIFLFFRIVENKFFFISHQQFGVFCAGPSDKIKMHLNSRLPWGVNIFCNVMSASLRAASSADSDSINPTT